MTSLQAALFTIALFAGLIALKFVIMGFPHL